MELPTGFIAEMREIMPEENVRSLMAGLTSEPSVSIRFNPFKAERESVITSLPSEMPGTPVPWSEYGYYLKERPSFTMNPLFHAGCFYVQEASSMFLEQAFRACRFDGPVTALDLCAAPGGKSTHLCSLLPRDSLLVSNEIMRNRAAVLNENICKWGADNVVVTNNTPEEVAASGGSFDLILVDAPCSGEGMFRKDETAIKEWNERNVGMCALRQREILETVWPLLEPGGFLIYSTCTFNSFENEENVMWMIEELGAEPIAVPVSDGWNISGAYSRYSIPVSHFFPGTSGGEGFFLALLRKKSERDNRGRVFVSSRISSASGVYREWLKDPDSFVFVEKNGIVTAFPVSVSERMIHLSETLRTVSSGIQVAFQKGREWAPSHALAMSRHLNRDAFPSASLTLQQALDYLHLNAIRLPDSPKGFVVVEYGNVPLGFVKNVGNRANNLYPSGWRIRKDVG